MPDNAIILREAQGRDRSRGGNPNKTLTDFIPSGAQGMDSQTLDRLVQTFKAALNTSRYDKGKLLDRS